MAKNWATDEIPAKKLRETAVSEDELLSLMEPMSAAKVPLKIGFFGGPGSGKTVAAMKAAQKVRGDGRVLYIDSAENFSSLMNHPELMEKVIKMKYRNMDTLWSLADSVRRSPSPKFQSISVVVFDEYSSMTNYDLNWITESRSIMKQVEDNEYKDPFKPDWPDYRALMIRSLKTITKFMKVERELHVIFVAHQKVDNDTALICGDFPAATLSDWEQLLHGIYHCTQKEDKETGIAHYQLQTKPVKRISAKNRIGGVGTYTTIEQLMEAYDIWGNVNGVDEKAEEQKVQDTIDKEIADLTDGLLD